MKVKKDLFKEPSSGMDLMKELPEEGEPSAPIKEPQLKILASVLVKFERHHSFMLGMSSKQ